MAGQPLALTFYAHGQAQGWRKGEDLIDALAYIDPLTPDVKAQVDKLIEEEMRQITKRPAEYLKELPPMPPATFRGHAMLVKEYNRVRAQEPMAALDATRFRLEPPPQAKNNDYGAWRAAADNAHAQLEHQMNRITNLELLLKHGPNSWRAQTQLDEAVLKQLEAQLQRLRKEVDGLNRERKLQQTNVGRELRELEHEYYGAVAKNLHISLACQKVQEEVDRLNTMQEQQRAGGMGQQQQQGVEQPQTEAGAAEGASVEANGVGEGGPEPMAEG